VVIRHLTALKANEESLICFKLNNSKQKSLPKLGRLFKIIVILD